MFTFWCFSKFTQHPTPNTANCQNCQQQAESCLCPSKTFFPSKYFLSCPFIHLKMKNQIGRLEVPFQVDASMTIMSFHVQWCRLGNSAKINSESKALNGLVQSSIIRGKRSENLQSKKWKFDHPPILKGIKKPDIIQKYLWILMNRGIIITRFTY